MNRIIFFVFAVLLTASTYAQNVVSISGNVADANGVGVEGVTVFVSFYETDEQEFLLTDVNGYFGVETGTENDTGCFEVYVFDCDGVGLTEFDCYGPDSTQFNYDFVYCANGVNDCYSFIIPENSDSISYELSTLTIGVAPFTYVWSDGSTSETITAYEGEEYCVTVTDNSGCESVACLDLSPPDPCFVNIFEEYSFNSVFLYAEGYGQDDNISYEWSTGETMEYIEVFNSGEYCVTLTDMSGCTSTDCKTIEIDSTNWEDCFAYIYSTFSQTDSSEVLVVDAFGQAPFTYTWSTGETTQEIIPEEQGTYCVTVVDASGCEFETCYEYIVWADCGVWIGCHPVEGAVQLVAFGYGADPLTYTWNTGDTGPEITVTVTEEYCVTIVDGAGCESTTCLLVNVEEVSECFSPIVAEYLDSIAILTVLPINQGEYQYYWSTGDSTQSITVFESGEYCVEVVEVETGCSFSTCTSIYLNDFDECLYFIEPIDNSDTSTTLVVVDIWGNEILSQNYLYTWSTGEVTPTITVAEEGTYCVTISNFEECTFETCLDVSFNIPPFENALIIGYYDAESGDGLSGVVELYSVDDDGDLTFYEEILPNEAINLEGLYVTQNVAVGSYVALARPEADDIYMPSYHINAVFWEDAQLIEFDGTQNLFEPIEIQAIKVTNLQGPGSIEGGVTDDQLMAKAGEVEDRSGDPVEDVNIMLRHNQVGVGQEYTSTDGGYFFDNLPYGTYEVILERPGYPRQVAIVTLSEDNPHVTDLAFEVVSTTSIENEIIEMSSLTLSPNPTAHSLAISTNFDKSQVVTLEILDAQGKLISSSSRSMTKGMNEFNLDVSEYDQGLYFLSIRSEKSMSTRRFIKL